MKSDQPSIEAYTAAAWMLDVDIAAIRAVAEVESGPNGAFNDDGSPVVLFEPHIFHQLTGGRFDSRYPELSYAKWKTRPYGKNSEQHSKLQRASTLDRDAALKSCSWGTFQIMGSNHRAAGHATVQRMVNAAYRSSDDHLRMFVCYIINTIGLADALRMHDWPTFKRIYNGPGENDYAERMAAAYARLS